MPKGQFLVLPHFTGPELVKGVSWVYRQRRGLHAEKNSQPDSYLKIGQPQRSALLTVLSQFIFSSRVSSFPFL